MLIMPAYPILEQVTREAMSGRPPLAEPLPAPIANDVIDRVWCVEMLEARAREFQKQKLFHIARALSSIAVEISSH
jgi:hypothetical protein